MLTKIDKALTAAILAGAGLYTTLQTQTTLSTQTKVLAAIVVGIVAGLGVLVVPNKPA